jgi:hypothetical protein
MTQARTIQIFLPDGNARSIRIADITSRTVQAIQIPRNKLKDANIRKEGDRRASCRERVYVLV